MPQSSQKTQRKNIVPVFVVQLRDLRVLCDNNRTYAFTSFTFVS